MRDGVRFAETEEEFRASYRLRYKVYIESMGRLKSKGDHDEKELRDEYDDTARAVVAIKNGEAIGTLRLLWGGDAAFTQMQINAYRLTPVLEKLAVTQVCIIERLMVDEKYRRSPTTLCMYKEVMYFVLAHQVEAVVLDCQPHHINSYLKLGFRPFTKSYAKREIGLVIPMVLIVGDYEHLKKIGSPFAILTEEESLNYCCHVKELLETIGQTSDVISQSASEKTDFLQQIYADSSLFSNNTPKIFDLLDESEIQRVIENSHILQFSFGDDIIDRANIERTIFVLLSGVVKIMRDDHLQAVISPGEVIGEIAYFLNIPRTANVKAATPEVKLLSLDDAALSRLMKFDAALANKILKIFVACYAVG